MKSLILIILVLLSFSCNENPTQVGDTSIKYYSGENSIDLNNDGNDDIYWKRRYIGNETTTDAIYSIYPINDAEILYSTHYSEFPFEVNDTIKFQAVAPFYWYPLRADLASYRYNTHQWNGRWVGTTGYLPVKISIKDSLHCAWINLTMDTLTQKIKFNFSSYNNKPNSDFIISK